MQSEIRALAEKLLRSKNQQYHVVAGLDGFIDEIIDVVQRSHAAGYDRFPDIGTFSRIIAGSAGKSVNLELAVKRVKLGGNGVILANALATMGQQMVYIGNLGYPEVDPIFAEFVSRCHLVYSLAEPGHTDALEFNDGKLMLGKLTSLNEITYSRLLETVGKETLSHHLSVSDLVIFGNWTMIHAMTDIWKSLLTEILPVCLNGRKTRFFFDLADPRKRDGNDIREALTTMSRFRAFGEVNLGLNEKESEQIAEVLDIIPAGPGAKESDLCFRAEKIRTLLAIDYVVIHPVDRAVCAGPGGCAGTPGPISRNPKITTGAGDNFNAGYCLARLHGFSAKESVLLGVATSGFYVRAGRSPGLIELGDFLLTWADHYGVDFE